MITSLTSWLPHLSDEADFLDSVSTEWRLYQAASWWWYHTWMVTFGSGNCFCWQLLVTSDQAERCSWQSKAQSPYACC